MRSLWTWIVTLFVLSCFDYSKFNVSCKTETEFDLLDWEMYYNEIRVTQHLKKHPNSLTSRRKRVQAIKQEELRYRACQDLLWLKSHHVYIVLTTILCALFTFGACLDYSLWLNANRSVIRIPYLQELIHLQHVCHASLDHILTQVLQLKCRLSISRYG